MNKIENFLKRYELTNYLGTTYEDNERITCYIKKHRIKKVPSGYIIRCKNEQEDQKGYVKPICYILNDITFNAPVIITGDKNTEIIIRNCNLYYGFSFTSEGKCIIDNCRINAFSTKNKYYAHDFKISNTEIQSFCSSSTLTLSAEKLDVNNIEFFHFKTKFELEATKELTIKKSEIISGNEISCKSKVLRMDNESTLGALCAESKLGALCTTEKVEIDVEDYNQLNIAAKEIILNGKNVNTENKRVTLKQISNPLKEKRIELTNLLRKIKNEYEKRNLEDIDNYEKQFQEKLARYKDEVNNKPIGK